MVRGSTGKSRISDGQCLSLSPPSHVQKNRCAHNVCTHQNFVPKPPLPGPRKKNELENKTNKPRIRRKKTFILLSLERISGTWKPLNEPKQKTEKKKKPKTRSMDSKYRKEYRPAAFKCQVRSAYRPHYVLNRRRKWWWNLEHYKPISQNFLPSFS